uniref:Uncharacterized protein n=1 Tax=Parastrongyloides trichosuri TaxID=131310 RepID=A0A0N4ZEW7_PARTI
MNQKRSISNIGSEKTENIIIDVIIKKISEICNTGIENNLNLIKQENSIIENALTDVFLQYQQHIIQLLMSKNDNFDEKLIDNSFVENLLSNSMFKNSKINIDDIVTEYNSGLKRNEGENNFDSLSTSSLQSISSSSYLSVSSHTNISYNSKLNTLASKVADEILRKMPTQEASNEMLKALITQIDNVCKQPECSTSIKHIVDTGVQTTLSPQIFSNTLSANKDDNLNSKEVKTIGLQTSNTIKSTSSEHSQSSSPIPLSYIISTDNSNSSNRSLGEINCEKIDSNNDFIVYEVNIDGSIAGVGNKPNGISRIFNNEIKKDEMFEINRDKCILEIKDICIRSVDNENTGKHY